MGNCSNASPTTTVLTIAKAIAEAHGGSLTASSPGSDQGATFTLTEKPAMPVEMWMPLLLTVLGFYCFFGAVLLLRMRLEVLKREARTSWVKVEVQNSLGARG